MHVPTLLDTCVNACFMDRDFALTHKKTLEKFYYPASVIVIDGQPIASSNIVEESESIRVVLNKLACVISFNINSSIEHLIVLSFP